MTLKYYGEERARYGEMGAIDTDTMLATEKLLREKFNVPHVIIKVRTRKTRRSAWSWYKPGLGMIAPNLRVAKLLAVPTIIMNSTMMTWLTFLHEFAHHVHYVRRDRQVRQNHMNAGGKPSASGQEIAMWARKTMKKEHSHGHSHRTIVQELVNFCLEQNLLAVKPLYLLQAQPATVEVLAA